MNFRDASFLGELYCPGNKLEVSSDDVSAWRIYFLSGCRSLETQTVLPCQPELLKLPVGLIWY